ncbi:RNA-binding protein [Bacillus paranthracis]
MKDSLSEVLQEGIGDKVKSVSEEIESYGKQVNQTLKNMNSEIREPIQKHGVRLKKIIRGITTKLQYTYVAKHVSRWISNSKFICNAYFNC